MRYRVIQREEEERWSDCDLITLNASVKYGKNKFEMLYYEIMFLWKKCLTILVSCL